MIKACCILAVVSLVTGKCTWSNVPGYTSGSGAGSCAIDATTAGTCTPACAAGYIADGTPVANCYSEATCPENTNFEDMRGCRLKQCKLPASKTGYVITQKTDDVAGCPAIDESLQTASLCTSAYVNCADLYTPTRTAAGLQNSATLAECTADQGEYTLSNCELAQCSFTAGNGVIADGCDTSSGAKAVADCAVKCDDANGYVGTATLSCAYGASKAGDFVNSGCVKQCTLPAADATVASFLCKADATATAAAAAAESKINAGTTCEAVCATADPVKYGDNTITCGADGNIVGTATCAVQSTCSLAAAMYPATNMNTWECTQDGDFANVADAAAGATVAVGGKCRPKACDAGATLSTSPTDMTCEFTDAFGANTHAFTTKPTCDIPPKCSVPAAIGANSGYKCGAAADAADARTDANTNDQRILTDVCQPTCAADSTPTPATMTCSEDSTTGLGSWGTVATCVQCTIPTVANLEGSIKCNSGASGAEEDKAANSKVNVGIVCQYTCAANKVKGVDSFTCGADGTWGDAAATPTCSDSCDGFTCPAACHTIVDNAGTVAKPALNAQATCCKANSEAVYAPTCSNTHSGNTCTDGMKEDARPVDADGNVLNNNFEEWTAAACCKDAASEDGAAAKAVSITLAVVAALLALVL